MRYVYQGTYKIKFSDFEWLEDFGGAAYAPYGVEWTLKDSMDFLNEFDSQLDSGDWHELVKEFAAMMHGEYQESYIEEYIEVDRHLEELIEWNRI